MSFLQFDRELVQRYDCAGPRYTSYPTAVQFRPDFSESAYAEEAARAGPASARMPLSLYVHLPFCTSPCFYCGCNRIITRSVDRGEAYLQRLGREIELQSALFDRSRTVEQLHFGGGTPTFYTPTQLAGLMSALREQFGLTEASTREYSIEIDPRTVTAESVAALAALGFNRMSLGVQDFDPDVQRSVNRVQPASDTLALMAAARAAGVDSIGFDLIYGLPRQTVRGFEQTLQTVVEARPDRIATYTYGHMPQLFKAQRRLSAQDLPAAETRLELLQLTIERLTNAGYEYIGMDHFALPGDELAGAKQARTLQRNFQGYSTHSLHDLVALGVSAIGKVGNAFAQNHKLLPDYYRALDAGHLPIQRGIRLTFDDQVRAATIQELMCHERVEFAALGDAFQVDFRKYFSSELKRLQPLAADGLVRVGSDCIEITPRGRVLLRNVAMIFDAYLPASPTQSKYSRVI